MSEYIEAAKLLVECNLQFRIASDTLASQVSVPYWYKAFLLQYVQKALFEPVSGVTDLLQMVLAMNAGMSVYDYMTAQQIGSSGIASRVENIMYSVNDLYPEQPTADVFPLVFVMAPQVVQFLLTFSNLVDAVKIYYNACFGKLVPNTKYYEWFRANQANFSNFISIFPLEKKAPFSFPQLTQFDAFVTSLFDFFPWGYAGGFSFSVLFDTAYAGIYDSSLLSS